MNNNLASGGLTNINLASGGLNNKNEIIICSFDIGEKNFTILIENYDLSTVQKLKQNIIPYHQRYNQNGECNENFRDFLNKLCVAGRCIFYDKFDMTSANDKKHGNRRIITNSLLIKLTNYLDTLDQKQIFNNVNYFVIEEQVKKADNNRQIQFHLRAYLLRLFLDFRPILLFPSSFKTRILGAPKKIFNKNKNKYTKQTYLERKKWSVDTAKYILTHRNDNEILQNLYDKKILGKPDDIIDCFIQNLSFINIVFIDDKQDLLNC